MLPFQSQLPAGDLPPVQVWSGDEHYRDVIRDWCKPPVHETSCHRAHRSEASELLTLDKGSGAVGVGGDCVRGAGKKVLTSLVDPERRA